ncbi:MAG: DUF4251 domain-containing protein [Bacteroidales bacterium]|nr:DUF4251 domain-containing protein [Bacteroidales bacterium]
MKKILAFVFAAVICASCGPSYRMTQAEREALAADVEWSVDNQDMIIDITAIYPFRGPVIQSSREYSLVIHDGVVRTRLPFFGESRMSVVYGVDDSSIVLEDAPLEELYIDRSRVQRKGEYGIYFQGRRRQATYHFSLSVFENGSVDIRVTTPGKTPMHYTGELYFEPVKP